MFRYSLLGLLICFWQGHKPRLGGFSDEERCSRCGFPLRRGDDGEWRVELGVG